MGKKSTVNIENANPNNIVQGINIVLPYIGDIIYTNVLSALRTIDGEREPNDMFMAQHKRNVDAERKAEHDAKVAAKPLQPNTAQMITEISKQFYSAILAPSVTERKRDDNQNVGNDADKPKKSTNATTSPAMSVNDNIRAVDTSSIAPPAIVQNVTLGVEGSHDDRRMDMDGMHEDRYWRRAERLRTSKLLERLFNVAQNAKSDSAVNNAPSDKLPQQPRRPKVPDMATGTNDATAREKTSIKPGDIQSDKQANAERIPKRKPSNSATPPAINSVADQTLAREEKNERFRDIEFETRVRKPKDELLYKLLKKWDNGDLKFGQSGKETTDDASSSITYANPLWTLFKKAAPYLAGAGAAYYLHDQFGKAGDTMAVAGAAGLNRIKNVGDVRWNQARVDRLKTSIPKENLAERSRLIKMNSQVDRLIDQGKLVEAEKRVDRIADRVARYASNDAARNARLARAEEATVRAANITAKGGIASKTLNTVGKVGKGLGVAGLGLGAVSSGMNAYERYAAGDTVGARNTAIGGGVDLALNAASLAGGPLNPLMWGNLAFSGTALVGKKLGLISETSADSIGDVVTGILDHNVDMERRREQLLKHEGQAAFALLERKANSIARQRPDLGDSKLILDKFMSTDRANAAFDRLDKASEEYVKGSGIMGQAIDGIAGLFGKDREADRLKAIDTARDEITKLFDDFASTYDPYMQHEWVAETQARIMSEQAAAMEPVQESHGGGYVSGGAGSVENGYEYNQPFDPGLMQQSVSGGMTASLLDPRYHELMRNDMMVIGQQLNTRMTGM